MQKKGFEKVINIKMLSGLMVWLVSGLACTCIISLIVCKSGMTEHLTGYFSSIVTFASAYFYSGFVCRGIKKGRAYSELVCTLIIIVTALTLGFLISSSYMDYGCVLSTATFSAAGCITGGTLDLRHLFTHKKGKLKISS